MDKRRTGVLLVKYILRMLFVVCLAGFFLFSFCSCSDSKAKEPSDSELTQTDTQPSESEPSEPAETEDSADSEPESPEETDSSEEQKEPSGNSSSEMKITPLFNLNHIIRYISELPPSVLGLSGNSMSEFRFYPSEGVQQVGESTLRQFIVYKVDENTGVNVFVQAYLIDMNSRQLYKLDLKTKDVEMLPYVPKT